MHNVMNLVLLATLAAAAQDLKDPYTRDEDISGTRVEVEYQLRDDGLYEYIYSLHAPMEKTLGA